MQQRAVQNPTDLHKDLAAHQDGQSFGKNIHIAPSPDPNAPVSAVASMPNRLQAGQLRRVEFLRRERSCLGWRFPGTLATRLVHRRRTQEAACPIHSSMFARGTEHW